MKKTLFIMALDYVEKNTKTSIFFTNVIGIFFLEIFIRNGAAVPTIPGPCLPCTCKTRFNRLKIANCSRLGLETIPAGLPNNIDILDLSFNRLKRYKLAALQRFKRLNYLSLANNNIEIITSRDFANLTLLWEIDLSGNLLTGIGKRPFENLGERLRSIRGIEASRFHTDVFKNLDKLRDLSIVFYQSIIPVGILNPLKGLQNLYMNIMNATTLPVGLFDFESNSLVKTLKIEGRNLIILPETILQGLSALSSFAINAERLLELPERLFHGGIFEKENGKYRNVVNLDEITIEGVKRLPGGLFQRQNQIRRIYLTKIGDVEKGLFDDLATLVHLEISNCSIGSVSTAWFSGCVSLRTLNLSHAQLTSIEPSAFSSLTSLVELDISNNKISVINRDILHSLRHSLVILNISKNILVALPPDMLTDMTKLELLDISYNNITRLPSDLLQNVGILTRLFVQGNIISEIPDSIFAKQYDLLQVDFSDNNISTIPKGLFSETISIEKIIMANNPLRCGCPVAEMLFYKNIEIVGSCLNTSGSNNSEVWLEIEDLKLNKSCFSNRLTTVLQTTSATKRNTNISSNSSTTASSQQTSPTVSEYNKTGKPDGPLFRAEDDTTPVVQTVEFFIATTTVGILIVVFLAWIGIYFGRRYMREKAYYTSGSRSGQQRSIYR